MQSKSFADQSAGVLLELPTSARAGGMAECYTALADDPFGVYYNPAGISFIKKPSVSFLYQQYLQDINGSFVALTLPGKNFSINAAPGFISMKEEPVYDYFGNDTGRKFKFQGTVIPLSGAYRLKDISFGATVKYYKEQLDDIAKDVTTFDAGVIYKYTDISLGTSLLNMSGKFGDYDLPKTIRFGIAYTVSKINILFDYSSQVTVKKNTYHIGGEVPVSDHIFIRLGYKLKDEFSGLSYGLGIKMSKFDIDYAASSYSELGLTQRASLNYHFEIKKKKEKAKEKVVKKDKYKEKEPTTPYIKGVITAAVADLVARNASAAEAASATDSIRSELNSIMEVNVIEKENMEMLLAEQKFPMSGCSSQECAVKMGKILNAKIVIIGSLSKLSDTYFINALIIDVSTGDILQSVVQEGISATKLRNACKQILGRIK